MYELKKFIIHNLFGEDNYEISFHDNRIILISENGVGKTTILNIMYAFLTSQWEKLIGIPFDFASVEFDFEGKEFEVSVEKKDFSIEFDVEFRKAYLEGFTYKDELEVILEKLNPENIINAINESREEDLIINTLKQINREKDIDNHEIEEFELQVNQDIIDSIKRKLPELVKEICSNLFSDRYKKLSLIGKVFYLPTYRRIEVPLKTLFSEKPDIKKEEGSRYLSLFEFGMEDIKSLIRNQTDRGIEKINEMIFSCNQYIKNGKELYYSEIEGNILVRKRNNELTLDVLSSGEKQLVSIFAYLYLKNEKFLVIFDEPELSYSLFWQKKILILNF
jgi:energy-coupling factor transporter ATP-binding protein EcfA2